MAFKMKGFSGFKQKEEKELTSDAASADFSTEYTGTEKRSMSSNVAKKMWLDAASDEERSLGHTTTQDRDSGDFIVRTKLSSKA